MKTTLDPQELIVAEYEKRSEAILKEMFMVLMRAQRKSDDEAYKKALEKLQ